MQPARDKETVEMSGGDLASRETANGPSRRLQERGHGAGKRGNQARSLG
jgi:hypothetical protein